MFQNINDYELLYLIKEQNEKALSLMYDKYSFLIHKVISVMNIPEIFRDEFLQEGLMILNNCIWKYNEVFEKTFCRFFELCLKRRFYRLIREFHLFEAKTIYLDSECEVKCHYLEEGYSSDYIINTLIDDELERLIAKEVLIGKLSPSYFAKKYNVNQKRVYNLVYKVKAILKNALQKK